jgi:hypothetical protein
MVNAIRNFFASVVVFVLLLCGFSIKQALACGDGVECPPDPINLGTINQGGNGFGGSGGNSTATGTGTGIGNGFGGNSTANGGRSDANATASGGRSDANATANPTATGGDSTSQGGNATGGDSTSKLESKNNSFNFSTSNNTGGTVYKTILPCYHKEYGVQVINTGVGIGALGVGLNLNIPSVEKAPQMDKKINEDQVISNVVGASIATFYQAAAGGSLTPAQKDNMEALSQFNRSCSGGNDVKVESNSNSLSEGSSAQADATANTTTNSSRTPSNPPKKGKDGQGAK